MAYLLKSKEAVWREQNSIDRHAEFAYNALTSFMQYHDVENIMNAKRYVDSIYNLYLGRKHDPSS